VKELHSYDNDLYGSSCIKSQTIKSSLKKPLRSPLSLKLNYNEKSHCVSWTLSICQCGNSVDVIDLPYDQQVYPIKSVHIGIDSYRVV